MTITDDFEMKLNQDQAVLVDVVRRAQKNYNKKLGRTALQKIPYFLKRRGVPLQYSFDLYHFGPFCQDILWDADVLVSVGAIHDEGGHNGGSKYIVTSESASFLSGHEAFLESHSKDIEAVVELLAPLQASTLEVVATIDYLYRYVDALGSPGPHKDQVLSRFMEAKPQYSDKQPLVSKLYDQMAGIKMIGE
jgi:uncharacterized protein YwgA